jgi:hypothetical protein
MDNWTSQPGIGSGVSELYCKGVNQILPKIHSKIWIIGLASQALAVASVSFTARALIKSYPKYIAKYG